MTIPITSASSGPPRAFQQNQDVFRSQSSMDDKKKRKRILMAASVEETCRSQGYNLIKVLGHGSYGTVFLCRSRRKVNDECAVKVIDTTRAEKIFVDKFLQRELDILLLVRHPFIVHIKSIVHRDQRFYIFMRYAEKGDLFDMISKHGRLDVSRARIWSAQLASALAYLHSSNIVHRDIKCENLLITRHNNMALSDFGFARQFTPRNGKPPDMTTFCGTKHYASPEVISSKPYDAIKSDVWAFGVVLFIMLTGTMPFLANNQKKIREMQQKEVWKAKVSLPEDIMSVFRNVFHLDQTRRWDSIQLKSADWFKAPSEYPKVAARHYSVKTGSEEFIRRTYTLKKNQLVNLPSLTESNKSGGVLLPSLMYMQGENLGTTQNEEERSSKSDRSSQESKKRRDVKKKSKIK